MKIFYKQPTQDRQSSLSRFEIQNCYFKKILLDRDQDNIIKKFHHHTGFEMHIVICGSQEYEVDGTIYKLESGCFLLIYPNVPHTVIASTPHTQKYSITFNKPMKACRSCFFGTITDRMADNIAFISNEASLNKEISNTLIENNILEIILLTFRLLGVKENENAQKQDENVIISLAKHYIDDNIELSPSVENVAKYCYLSTKQLTRIFCKFEGVSPKEYIIGRRIMEIEKLLADHTLSLKQISEIMNFDNEYYFSAFFKKNSGMPPGAYRKMLGQ